MIEARSDLSGMGWAVIGVVCFSCNDVLVKFLSGGYPLYQLIFLRSIVGLTVILTVIVPLTGDLSMLRTRRLVAHIARGLCVVFANFCFFLGLAVLPLADAVAIFFVSPLLITVLSMIILKESVGPRRWAAIGVGLLGVLIVLRPGTASFQAAAFLPLAAAAGYAFLHILTRRIGGTENATQMSFYIQLTFLVVSGTAGLALGDGRLDIHDHPSAVFLLRAWVWPAPADAVLIAALGLTSAMGGYSISAAYRATEAALVAPFEYIAMPMAVIWGLTIFGEVPDVTGLVGIALILGSGMVLIWREARARRPKRL